MNVNSTLVPPREGRFIALGADSGMSLVPPALIHRVIVAVVILLAGIIGAIGNALVILSVVVSKKLRTSTNAFVVNLAVADFLTSLFLPFLSLSLLLENDPPIPFWLCGITMGFVFSCLCCSLYTLASIGLNRLLLITRPTHFCKRLFQPKVLTVWISCIWLYSTGVIVIPLILDLGQLGYDESYHMCGWVNSHPEAAMYESIIVLGLYPVPLLIIVFSYLTLYVYVSLHGRRMLHGTGEPVEMSSTANSKSNNADKRCVVASPVASEAATSSQQVSNPVTNSFLLSSTDNLPRGREVTPDVTPNITPIPVRRQLATTCENCTPNLGQMRKSARKKISKRHLQITKNLFYIVLAFLVCLTPYFIVFILGLTNEFIIYAGAAVFFNSCVNPFVYATKHPHFKKVFKCILLCRIKSVPEPADFLRSLESMMKV